tara:strand:- start:280 stop:1281 length:1002 start_codon:yes stop_codon:yes gene_type:complete
MIELEVLRPLLINDSELASSVAKKYGLINVLKVIKKNRIRNYFLRLIRNLDETLNIISLDEQKKYVSKFQQAQTLSKKLSENNVNHIFFKGVVLSNYFYDFPSDRTYTDFDILIDKKNSKEFYKFLDEEGLHHKNNIHYIDRVGYTRTALEVIKSKNNLVYDFHHRIVSKIRFRHCPLTKIALKGNTRLKGINIPQIENLLLLTLHHSYYQNNTNLTAQTVLDINQLLNEEIDKEKIEPYLKKLNLLDKFQNLLEIINRIKSFNNDRDLILFAKRIFENESKIKNLMFNGVWFRTQLCNLIDPEPYINYTSGNKNKNLTIELLKTKLRRKKLR